jgi:chromate transport protein ChrA
MTSQDHNKTIAIIYSFLGLVLAGAAIIWLGKDVRRHQNWLLAIYKDAPLIAAAIVSTCLLSTVYGMVRKRRWGRVLALVTTAFYVWLFPLGTLLAVYLWWFLHSEGAKTLYGISTEPEQ